MGIQRLDDFRKVIDYVQPDIIAVQEMQNQQGVDLFCDSVLNYPSSAFCAVPFNDGPDTDNSLFYRQDKIELISTQYILTPNRNIAQYYIRIKKSQKSLYVFSVHFKSSQGSENEVIRLHEATILRSHLDSLDSRTDFLVVGDFNFYYEEPGFYKLTDSLLTGNNGRLFDPLVSHGSWHDNSIFAYTHTQSSRVDELPDGGIGGGLDDRFDMILSSKSLLDTSGLYLHKDSYTICGNDCNHFNKSVNYGINHAVPDEVADALYYASDHLPVYVNILDMVEYTALEEPVKIWPNPMEEQATIHFPWHEDFLEARLTITNILGQHIYETRTISPIGVVIKRGNMPIGIYFIHLRIKTKYGKHDYRTKLAVIK